MFKKVWDFLTGWMKKGKKGGGAASPLTYRMVADGGLVTVDYPGEVVAKVVILRAGPSTVSDEYDIPSPTHYASPTGGGDGLSQGSPFLVSDFMALPPSPGDHLALLDGVYTGANSMITAPAGVSGTENNPIYVSALNDGEVRINGGGLYRPITLRQGASWWHVFGMDCHNSGEGSVVSIGSTEANNNIVRRVCAWDTHPTKNGAVFDVAYCSGNLIEDCAGWGWGRRVYQDYAGGNGSSSQPGNTFRRCWGTAMGWQGVVGGQLQAPNKAVQIGYQGFHATVENCIIAWDLDPTSYLEADRGHLCIGRIDSHPDADNQDAAFYGCIAYQLSEFDEPPPYFADGFTSNNAYPSGSNIYKDIVVYAEEVLSSTNNTYFRLQEQSAQSTAADITEIGPTPSDSFHGSWTVSNRVVSTTVGGAPSPFQATSGSGARVYYRYKNRTLTATKLWPWPMDARIRAALTDSGRDPDTIFRGSGNGVTELMESIFGAIP